MTAITSPADRVREVLHTWLDEHIGWHPDFGATSSEQWEIETEQAFVRAMKQDDALVAHLVSAATEEPVVNPVLAGAARRRSEVVSGRDDLELLRAIISEAEMQVVDDGQDVRVTFHAKGDGFTPFATFTTRSEVLQMRRLLGPDRGSEVER